MTEKRTTTISAVVVTYNNAATLAGCLEGLISHGISSIVVVDNASRDETVKVAQPYPIRLVQQTKNIGFAAAANIGAAKATTKYILFLNPDAVLQNSPKAVLDLMESDSKVGIAGLGLYDMQGNPEPDSFGEEPTLTSLLTRKFYRQPRVSSDAIARGKTGETGPAAQVVDWTSGGALLVRTDAFRALGGFDEQFFLYWEDVDLCRRARHAGFVIAHAPAVRVQHQRGASLNDRQRKAVLYDTSADRYFQKHYAAPIWLIQQFLRRLYRLLQPLAR